MSDSKGDGNELLPVVVSSFSRLASDLPYDICCLIFSPFSTINLNELRLVNREWNYTIQCFLERERRRERESLLIIFNRERRLYVIHQDHLIRMHAGGQGLTHLTHREIPQLEFPVRVIVGCCEGLVLLLLGAWYRPFVLNPRTGTMHQVAVEDRHSFRRTYAIGWMVLGGVRCHVVLRCFPGYMRYIDVYNLRTLTWTRRNTNGVTTAIVTSWESSAFVGAIFLWLGRFENRAAVVIYNGTNDGVSYFHVSPPLPRGLEVTISNLDDACAALWDNTADRRCFWIVKIEENTWERTAVSGARSRFQPLALIPDSGYWILLSENVRLVLYDFSTDHASTLNIARHPFNNLWESPPEDIILAISFTESFHSPGRIDAGVIQD